VLVGAVIQTAEVMSKESFHFLKLKSQAKALRLRPSAIAEQTLKNKFNFFERG
jgi:hypothetical protein